MKKLKNSREYICSRCNLIVSVPGEGRSIFRLGPCPSCDMVAWISTESKN